MFDFNNLKSIPIRKFLNGILKEQYPLHDEVVQRMLHNLSLDSDMKKSAELFKALYLAGYQDAIKQYSKDLEKIGHKVEIVYPDQDNQHTY